MSRWKLALIAIHSALFLAACGGGGSSSGGGTTPPPPPPPPPAPLSITTASSLPGAVQNKAYSATLAAANGQGALHWSIAPISSFPFVNGLVVDANTGVISGTATFQATAQFTATVTDSASPSRSATQTFSLTAFQPLSPGPDQNATLTEFQPFPSLQASVQGGVPPIRYTVGSGALPPGIRFNSVGQSVGAAFETGTYTFTLTAQDSFSTPETTTENFAVTVRLFPLSLQQSLPARVAQGQVFQGRIIAVGGVPPYTFAPLGSLPTWLTTVDAGNVAGIPPLGTFVFTVKVTDSSPTPQSATAVYQIQAVQPIPRNDTPTNATAISNGSYSASISPYIDPPNGVPDRFDNDYYKISSVGNSVVHLETRAKRFNANNPLDTVIEIVNVNNTSRFATCRQPGVTGNTFTSSCINDDIAPNPVTQNHIQDSALDFQVPGDPNTEQDFYVHVFDWSGNSRPDMVYTLNVSGVIARLQITSNASLTPARVANTYFALLTSTGGMGAITWTVSNGTPPPGLTLSATGVLSGIPTTPNTYTFTVQATDSAASPQTTTQAISITITP
jgi:hypothetical protein